MSDFYVFDNPTFEPEEVDDDEATTSFIDVDESVGATASYNKETAGAKVGPLRQGLLRTAVNDYYNNVNKEQDRTPALGRDYSKFKLVSGRLRLKAYPDVELVKAHTSKPLKLSTVAGRSGISAVRDELGFVDFRSMKPSKAQAKFTATLQAANNELGGAAAAVDTVELKDLGQIATEASGIASDTIHTMETTFTDTDDPPLNLREIRGLDKAMQTIRGELTNNLAKLSVLDDRIALEKRKLTETDNDELKNLITERLRNIEDERAARLEAASTNREALRSQINRFRETIHRILNEDTTLAERIRTLFREHGITIASILTAIGMTISTLVFALTGGSGAVVPTPPPPSDKGGLKEWAKKHLRALGRVLANLAGKAAAALPGIIGSLVSWLLNLLGKTVTWLAENVWAIVLTVGGLLIVAAREWLAPSR
jgi:hypothetical protein